MSVGYEQIKSSNFPLVKKHPKRQKTQNRASKDIVTRIGWYGNRSKSSHLRASELLVTEALKYSCFEIKNILKEKKKKEFCIQFFFGHHDNKKMSRK